ncbi:hypothetical protein BDZ97DRAFT_1659143 [Flammula alnicola]|nr:hypothetical protein BDZ97DRAFT_1659143 [Flammula alnicola]
MRLVSSTVFVVFALLVDLTIASDVPHNPPWRRRHPARGLADPVHVEQNVTTRALEKRFDGARFTFYDAGLGACGQTNSASDFQYAGGAHCFETISITVGSKTHSAQIVDECPGCPFAGLDFSRGLFDSFASESAGVLTGSWNFGGSAAPPPPPPPPPPTHTPPPPPPPPKTTVHNTPTFTPPTTTHTTTAPASSASSSASAASQDALRSASSSGSAAPAASSVAAAPPPINNLEQIYLAFVAMGSIAIAGPGVSGSS